ncbi:MAG: 4-hydroxy-3-methylbut-2-en-1-yl diphosphate synthase [Planctomycetota bacterium]|nr:MAG: 4-hydroxy-3-methylbut-2-en-1-yl diphosphate synthase [Planctomycetota bacterium]
MKYCENTIETKRRPTREVMIGNVGVGGNNPIRVQSMTTTPTLDTKETVAQTLRLVDVGCEIVRITAQGPREAKNLGEIKKELLKVGCNVPLVADIHFNPNAAMEALKHVEKIRINPGNFADTKIFLSRDYTDKEYELELQRIRDKFVPLVKELKDKNVALRIGTNHGSLSDRIMNRFGDTPLGMVESALEFARICEDEGYYEFMFSMKSSNPQVMIQAYRLLTSRMYEINMDAPLHLGVTEAGDGDDGRVKSALGIGALLDDGLGDTIRVSLTEEPEEEVPVAFALLENFNSISSQCTPESFVEKRDPLEYLQKDTFEFNNIGGGNVPIVASELKTNSILNSDYFNELGYQLQAGQWVKQDVSVDYLIINREIDSEEFNLLTEVQKTGLQICSRKNNIGIEYKDFSLDLQITDKAWVEINLDEFTLTEEFISHLKILSNSQIVFVLSSSSENYVGKIREFQNMQDQLLLRNPVILKRICSSKNFNEIALQTSFELGTPLIDGFGNGFLLESSLKVSDEIKLIYLILQATRKRITKTEFISCPSCGRTLFDLQETTNRIRDKTGHLVGVKIAIMGCIVNGPGEMADADFGYVGSAHGKVNLYIGKELVKRGIDETVADEELIQLIREQGVWVEPHSIA